MTKQKQITLEEALKLVDFSQTDDGTWIVQNVHSDVDCNVDGTVHGTIAGLEWEYIETHEERFRKLLDANGDQELIEAFNRFPI